MSGARGGPSSEQSLSTDATQPPARFIVTEPETTHRRASLRAPTVLIPQRVPHTPRWRDPSGADMFRSSLAVGASAAALTVMVLTSLLLVSLAAARPASRRARARGSRTGVFPHWIAGPTGVLTSWFTAVAHAERVLLHRARSP